MSTDKKIALLIKLLEKRYPCEKYDKSNRFSTFRLRQDLILNKLARLELELEERLNHE